MLFKKGFLCALFFVATTVNAFDLSEALDGQLRDAEFEFDVGVAILSSEGLRKNAHIVVSRNENSILIVGQATSQELKGEAQQLVLDVARLKWIEGDVNHVEPSNARVCGEKASTSAANSKRRFNLKQVAECSTVNRFYNEVRISPPLSEIEQSDDELLRATIINQLLRASIIDKADVINVVVSDSRVYLLGDQLTQATAQKATVFVEGLPDVEMVVPLFRF